MRWSLLDSRWIPGHCQPLLGRSRKRLAHLESDGDRNRTNTSPVRAPWRSSPWWAPLVTLVMQPEPKGAVPHQAANSTAAHGFRKRRLGTDLSWLRRTLPPSLKSSSSQDRDFVLPDLRATPSAAWSACAHSVYAPGTSTRRTFGCGKEGLLCGIGLAIEGRGNRRLKAPRRGRIQHP